MSFFIHISLNFSSQLLVIVLYILSTSTRFSISVLVTGAGWRVGWAIAPAFIAAAIRNIHVKITDSAPAPFQEAALTALRSPPEYFESLRRVGSKERLFNSYLVL